MEAVVIKSSGKVELTQVEDPSVGPREVAIAVKAAGLCGTDLHIYQGEFPASLPLIPGHEFAGEVIEIGQEVGTISVGDRVTVDPNVPCRRCSFCKSHKGHFCRQFKAYGVNLPGGFAQRVVVREENIYSISELSYEQGALIEPLACVLHGVELVGVNPGEEVLIFGVGPIGLLLAQVCKIKGASTVAAVDLFQEKLDFAKALGVDETFCNSPVLPKQIAERGRFDLVIDATGVPQVVEALPKYVQDGGRILYFGVCPQGTQIKLDPFDVYRRELKIFGTFSLLANFLPAINLVKRGRVNVEAVISHKLALSEIKQAFELAKNRDSRKILLFPSELGGE